MDLKNELKPKNNISNFLGTVVSPLQKFAHLESSSGIVLIFTTIIAMFWANSPWAESYLHMQHMDVSLNVGTFAVSKTLHHWVNDGLMVIFFFVVGMEIKRELVIGELSSPKKAALPIFAALGGMAIPALFYAFFNAGTEGAHGWAIPMATDIAFAVGVLVLLGKRVPMSLMIFLLALAIVDDLGAVVVIAAFYTETVSATALGWAVAGLAFITILKFAGVRPRYVYFVISLGVWFAVLKSGVHATVAGVILGLLTPIKALVPLSTLQKVGTALLQDPNTENFDKLEFLVYESQSPVDNLIDLLHPWVNFVIMPTFALMNAGIPLSGIQLDTVFHHPITLGVLLGLALGKPLGIFAFSWLAVKFKLASLPTNVTWPQIFGVGALGGIGFTMALFIGHLSFKNPDFEVYSKVGILSGSTLAAIIGACVLLLMGSKEESAGK